MAPSSATPEPAPGPPRVASLAEIHAAIVHADVHGVLVVQESTDVRHGRVQQLGALVKLALLLIRGGKRAGIGEHGQVRDGAVAHAGDVYQLPALHVATVQPSVDGDVALDVGIVVDATGRGDVLETIADDVRVRGAPRQRAKLGRGDEPREVEGVALVVPAVLHAAEVE